MQRRVANLLCSIILFGAFHAEGQTSKLQGYWLEPSGGIIHVASCDAYLCAKIVSFSREDGPRTDVNNQDRALRTRSLCGLELGAGSYWEPAIVPKTVTSTIRKPARPIPQLWRWKGMSCSFEAMWE